MVLVREKRARPRGGGGGGSKAGVGSSLYWGKGTDHHLEGRLLWERKRKGRRLRPKAGLKETPARQRRKKKESTPVKQKLQGGEKGGGREGLFGLPGTPGNETAKKRNSQTLPLKENGKKKGKGEGGSTLRKKERISPDSSVEGGGGWKKKGRHTAHRKKGGGGLPGKKETANIKFEREKKPCPGGEKSTRKKVGWPLGEEKTENSHYPYRSGKREVPSKKEKSLFWCGGGGILQLFPEKEGGQPSCAEFSRGREMVIATRKRAPGGKKKALWSS